MSSVVKLLWAKAHKVIKRLLSPQRTQRSKGEELVTSPCSAKRLGGLGGKIIFVGEVLYLAYRVSN